MLDVQKSKVFIVITLFENIYIFYFFCFLKKFEKIIFISTVRKFEQWGFFISFTFSMLLRTFYGNCCFPKMVSIAPGLLVPVFYEQCSLHHHSPIFSKDS